MSLREHWDNLADRERRAVSIGGVLVFILLVYLLLWLPLSDAVANNQMNVKTQRALLQYLQNANEKIQTLKAQGIQLNNTDSGDLLTITEKTLSSQQLSLYLKQVQQPKQNQLTLTFQQVPFDKMMEWLSGLTNTQGVDVMQFSAEKLSDVGTANVMMTLSLSI